MNHSPRSALARLALFASFVLIAAPAAAGCGVFFPSKGSSGKQQQQQSWEVHPVRLSAVGYFPERAKLATIVPPADAMVGDLAGVLFEVRSGADDSVLWSSPIGGPVIDAITGKPVWLADFSGFCELGEDLYISVPGVGRSASFRVANDVYDGLFVQAMLGLHGQRCGTAVEVAGDGESWKHGKCHTKDAYLKYLTGEGAIRPSTGGWHDAGDYGKYVTNGAFTVGMMLAGWERFQPAIESRALPIPEHGGPFPDYLAEVKWELDWLLTTQQPDGSVVHKVTARMFEGFVAPDSDASARYYTGVGTSATADFVAVMAAAARIYQPYGADGADFAARALAAAQLGYAFLQANPDRIFPNLGDFSTGTYGDNDDRDERLWAAAELWETTGDPAALADLEARLALFTSVDSNFDWGNVGNLGLFTYGLSARDGRDPTRLGAVRASIIASGDALSASSLAHPYGRAFPGYWWGSNGAVARTAMNLAAANALAPAPKYLDAMAAQVDHLLGRNAYDRSQVTGLGYHPPLHPHHRPSASDNVDDPWPGLLVGGQDQASAYDWSDDQNAANLNEVAINWNGALVFATGGFLSR